jgi:hypothetical protein
MSIWGRRGSEPPAGEAPEGQAAAGESRAGAHDAQEPGAEHRAGEPAPAFWRAQGEPPAAGGSPAGAGAPAPVLTGVVIDGETAVKDPAFTGTQADQAGTGDAEAGTGDAEAGPAVTEVQEPTVAVAREPVVDEAQEPLPGEAQKPAVAGGEQPAAATPQRWSEILVAFVDDPRGSVQMAADAVDEAIDDLVNSARARQRAMASSWQGTDAGTEQLRGALRDYRTLWHQIERVDLGGKTGA